jgi:hypothetical protein
MTLRATVEADIVTAMRERNETARDTLRMVMAAVKTKEIDLGREASDEEVSAVLAHAVKTRRESIVQFEKGGREDLAATEREQIEVLSGYLPEQLDEAATRTAVAAVVADLGVTGKADMGRVMKELMARHKGSVDGKLAGRLVGEALS